MEDRRAWRSSWVAAGCLVAGCLVPGGCGAGASKSATAPPAGTTTTASVATTTASVATSATVATSPPTPRPRGHRPHKPPPDPGTLPQTRQLPSAGTHTFKAEMAALWRAIRFGAVKPGRRAFFPEAAYAQVKAIADPQSDYQGRLMADYALDIAAAHALLGAHPRGARLLAVDVPAGYAHWVPPGVCYNRVGYYEVPNSRVVYRQNGAMHSFGIASMISWRGVWYVVHLGAVSRGSAEGVVDDPSDGEGESVASSTC